MMAKSLAVTHHDGQVVGRHKFGEFQNLALCCCQCGLFAHLLAVLLAALAATVGGLLAGLGGQAGQRLLHLALNILLAHFGTQGLAVALLVLATLATLVVTATTALVGLR